VRSRASIPVCSLVAALALLACGAPERRRGDVGEIRAAGQLRVAVRPGFRAAPSNGNGGADEVILLGQLASRLGVTVRWIEADRHDQVLPMVRNGLADIGVIRFSPASLLEKGIRGTVAIDWVEDLLVSGRDSGLDSFEKVSGASVHLHRSAITATLRSFLLEEGLSVEEVPEEVPIEEMLRRVRTGRYDLTIVDSGIAETEQSSRRMVTVGPVAERRALVWAVRDESSQLRLAVDRFFFAERVLSGASGMPACRDLQQIRQTGALRLVTRNSATTCTVERGGIEGFEYDLAVSFARSLRVRLELSIPPPDVDPLDWLELGYGDFTALHEPLSPEDAGGFLASVPYRRVDLVSVVSTRTEPPAAVEDLTGRKIAASRPVADLCRLLPLAAPVRVLTEPNGADAFNAMLEVARGNVSVAVVDEDAARFGIADRADLQMGPVILPQAELVWTTNVSAPNLHRALNRWLREARSSGFVRQLVLSQFGSWTPHLKRTLLPIPEGALSPYDELLQWVGRRYGIDWRLLASLMYEESRFDPDAVGPGGSAGLFQFMPFTWQELGVEDPHDPYESAESGGRYLRQLMDQFDGLLLPDQVAMAIASYNVGPRHVFDARILAREMGFDSDQWRGAVETAMVLLDDPELARQYPAGVCRCRRAANYVRRILRRYAAYVEQFPPA
jgi:membrane-bound lytic murein transglycosylase F